MNKNQTKELLIKRGCTGRYSGNRRVMYVHGPDLLTESTVAQGMPITNNFQIISHRVNQMKIDHSMTM